MCLCTSVLFGCGIGKVVYDLFWLFLCLFIYSFRLACFDMAPQADISRFLYLEAESLYIHYATLLSADICLRIKTKGASFFYLSFFFEATHSLGCVEPGLLAVYPNSLCFIFCKVSHMCMCMKYFPRVYQSMSPFFMLEKNH